MLASISTWAQPTASTPEVGKSYYLYNPKTGRFLVSLNGTPYVRSLGNAWTIIDGSSKEAGYIQLRLKDDESGYLWGIYWAAVGGSYSSYPDETYYKPIKQGETDNYKLLMYSWSSQAKDGNVYINTGGGNRVAGNSHEQAGLDADYTLWEFISEEDYLEYSKNVGYPFSEIPSVDYTAQGSAPAGGKTYVLYNETGKFLYNDADGKTPKISSSQATYYTFITTGSEYYIRSNTGDLYKQNNSNWNTWTNGNQGDEAKWSATLDGGKYKLQNHNKAANTHYFAPNSNGEGVQCYCDKTSLTGWYLIDITDKDVAVSLLYALQQAEKTYYVPAHESDAKDALREALNNVYVTYVIAPSFTSSTYDTGKAAIDAAINEYENSRFDYITGNEGGEDITSWIVNPTPTSNGSGWTLSQTPTYDSGNNCAEYWSKSGASLSQEITKELPAGYYRLTNVALTRTGMTAQLAVSGATSGALNSMNISTVGSGTVNDRAQAKTWFDAGYGVNELDFYVPSTQKVTISLTADNTTGDHWLVWRSFQLTAIGTSEGNVLNLEKYLDNAALTPAKSARDDDSNDNIIGTERTNLVNAIDALDDYSDEGTVASDVAARKSLKYALVDPYNEFTESSVKTNYDALVTEIAKAKALGIDAEIADAYAATSSSTSASVLASTQDLMVDEYEFVRDNYQTPISLGSWTETGTNTMPTDFNNQHWSGTAVNYKNQNDTNGQGWNANTWSMGLNQDITLPAGDYVLKVAGRKSQDAYITLTVTKKSDSSKLGEISDFPSSNDAKGINTSGETDFATGDGHNYANGGKGYGWQWRYVPFSLTEETTVNIAVAAGSSLIHNWASFGDYAVWSKPNVPASLIAYNKAKDDAATAKSEYPSVTGSELTDLNDALDADPGSTVESIDAATADIIAKTGTLIAAAPSYDAYLLVKGYGEAIDAELLPYATSAKLSAVTAALATSVTSASTAEAATAAINTANRAAYESNAMAENVPGVSRTNLIKNAYGSATAGWSGSFGTASGEPYTQADGTTATSYFDKNGVKTFTTSQTIKLPKGNYILSVTARAQSDIDSYKMQVTNNADESEEVDLSAIGNQNGVFGRGWNDFFVVFEQKAFGDATISVVGDNTTSDANFWMSWGRFRLYSIGGEEAYVISEDEAYTPVNGDVAGIKVSLARTIKSDVVNTLVLPFDMSQSEVETAFGTGSKVYVVDSYDAENEKVVFSQDENGITANKPCLLKATSAGTAYNFTGRTLKAGTATDTGENISMTGNYAKPFTVPENNYIISGGSIYLVNSEVAMKTMRAYITLTNSSSARVSIAFDDDDPTAINAIEAAEESEDLKDGKYLIDSKIVIVKNGVKYSANGQILK